MNYLQRLIQEVRIVLLVMLLLNNILLFGVWYVAAEVLNLRFEPIVAVLLFASIILNFLLAWGIGAVVNQPIRLLWRNILHVSPFEGGEVAVGKLTTIWLGKDLVAALTNQVHQLAMVADTVAQTSASALPDLHKNFVANSLPLPMIVLDKNGNIAFANTAALKYFERYESDFVGHSLQHKLSMVFSQADQDFDSWLQDAQNSSATATKTWESVNVTRGEGQTPLQFDLAAFYNKDNPEGAETLLVCFDHSEKYAQEDQEVGFVALAVHELRTPVTMLRGYLEALDEELDGKLDAETMDFFNKMKASSQQLTIFLNNILNIARIEGNQLDVQLQEAVWSNIVGSAIDSMRLRAQVHGLSIVTDIPADLPTVGADPFSITEVLTNVIDNAIKYSSGKGEKIVIRSYQKDGMVETTVEDSGVGIPESVIPTLFNKFQRNFHNKASISGTGIGLYLSKVIVNLHGGNIWVSSKEGNGTTVGFTLNTYASLSDGQVPGDKAITHHSQGWIKNHSMSRR